MNDKQAIRERLRAARRTEFSATVGGLGEILKYLTDHAGRKAEKRWITAVWATTGEGPDGPYHAVGFTYSIPQLGNSASYGGSAEMFIFRTRNVADRVAAIIRGLANKA